MMGQIKFGGSDGKYQGWKAWFIPEIRDEYYSIPRVFEDQTVFVIGGGPSIKHTNLKLVKDRNVLGCNDAFRLGTWVDWIIFADKRWWVWNHEELEKWPNRDHALCLVPQLMDAREAYPWLKFVRRDEARFGLSVEQDTICWNRGCGGAAINAAYLLGARRIVLLGFDMRVVENKHNWHDYHQKEERPKIYQNSMMPFLKPMSDAMKVTGLEIVNCTPGSALNLFPERRLEEILELGW